MGRTLRLIVLFLLLVSFSGCAYVNIRTPYDKDLDRTTLGEKVGKANLYSFLWLFAWGDAGTEAAAKNGNISVINHMDRQTISILFGLIYYQHTTIVYGD